MPRQYAPTAEWLEADGLGGFASGTVCGRRTRRYHALLLAASTPPTGRFVLVNGIDAWVESKGQTQAISSQYYLPGIAHPGGDGRLISFVPEPWPRWRFRLDNGVVVEQELFVTHGHPAVAVRWRLVGHKAGERCAKSDLWLHVRPLLSGRDYHALRHENSAFRFDAEVIGERARWTPYAGVPGIGVLSNADYRHGPLWYRNFLYQHEVERGLDAMEDLAAPGVFRWNLTTGDALWIAWAEGLAESLPISGKSATDLFAQLSLREERRRRQFRTPLARAADAYIVRRDTGRTIIAGYPWFTDWGRDTFIALRGLAVATGRLDVAREVLLAWSGVVSQGMLPNRFPDHGDRPEFNSVDASLWYVIAVYEYLSALTAFGEASPEGEQHALLSAVRSIMEGYVQGTRHRIQVDNDGLLAAGEEGLQLTWMDAKIGDWVVTARIGKPVELQALWLNAVWIAQGLLPGDGPWSALLVRGLESFSARFWNAERGYLFDVIDVDHEHGRVDAALRPNQILAIGGLPLALLGGERARKIVDVVERTLWTPLGLRSLSPDDPAYRPHYQGGVWDRDSAYHQGTVWPWLVGPFVEAWLRVHGNTPDTRQVARQEFLQPLFDHLHKAGLGHISEIADAEPPHTPRGCPFQAWSLGELLRLAYVVLPHETGVTETDTPVESSPVSRASAASTRTDPIAVCSER